MGKRRGAYRASWRNVRERDHLKGPDTERRIILK
jgi:hypothetical protein